VFQTAQEYDEYIVQQITTQMSTLRVDRSHNDYLQTLAEQGIVGFCLFILLLFSALSSALYVLWTRTLTQKDSIVLLGCLTIVMQTTLQSVYDFSLRLPASSLFFGLALGGILVALRKCPAFNVSISIPVPVRCIMAALVLVVSVYCANIVTGHLTASHLRNIGSNHLKEYIALKDVNRSLAVTSLKNAERYLNAALEKSQDDGKILHELGRMNYFLYSEEGSNEIQYLQRSRGNLERAKHTFYDPETYSLLCSLYCEEHRYAVARLYSDMLLLIDPQREESQYLAGLIDYLDGKMEDAVEHFQNEISTNEDHQYSHIYIARSFMALKQYPAAALAFESCLELNEGLVDPRIRLADLYVDYLNDPLKAKIHYQQAQQLAPMLNEPNRTLILEELKTKLRRVQQKIDMIQGINNE